MRVEVLTIATAETGGHDLDLGLALLRRALFTDLDAEVFSAIQDCGGLDLHFANRSGRHDEGGEREGVTGWREEASTGGLKASKGMRDYGECGVKGWKWGR